MIPGGAVGSRKRGGTWANSGPPLVSASARKRARSVVLVDRGPAVEAVEQQQVGCPGDAHQEVAGEADSLETAGRAAGRPRWRARTARWESRSGARGRRSGSCCAGRSSPPGCRESRTPRTGSARGCGPRRPAPRRRRDEVGGRLPACRALRASGPGRDRGTRCARSRARRARDRRTATRSGMRSVRGVRASRAG